MGKNGTAAGTSSSLMNVGGGDGGWMTTKKRGRDDKAIARDSAKALEARRNKRNNGGKQNNSNNHHHNATQGQSKAKKTKGGGGRRKNKSWRDDDGEDDDDDFVVDDDEEVLEASSSEASFDDNLNDEEEEEEEESSSEEEDIQKDTFFKTYQKRTSKAVPLPQQQQQQQQRRLDNQQKKKKLKLSAGVGGRKQPDKKKKQKEVYDLQSSSSSSSSSEGDDDDDDFAKKKPAILVKKKPATASVIAAGSALLTSSRFFQNKRPKQDDSPSFLAGFDNNNNKSSDEDDNNLDGSGKSRMAAATIVQQQRQPNKKMTKAVLDSPGDTSQLGVSVQQQQQQQQQQNKTKKKIFIQDDSDDDDDLDVMIVKSHRPTKNKNNKSCLLNLNNDDNVRNDDTSDNESYVANMNWALEESRKVAAAAAAANIGGAGEGGSDADDSVVRDFNESHQEYEHLTDKKLKTKKKKASNSDSLHRLEESESEQDDDDNNNKNKKKTVFLEDDEVDDDEDDNDDEQDGYVLLDEDAKEACSVLDTANELSAYVLKTMTAWMTANSTSTTPNKKDATTIPVGMIVDGALSLATIHQPADNENALDDASSSSSSSSQHQWISHAYMKNLCPNLTLSDYQLVGVNWLALLHDMEWEMKGTTKKGKKQYTKVNGVLADEMGLGKTVQTIAFLAWLAYKNQCKPSSKDDPILLDDDENEEKDTKQENNTILPHLVVAPASVLSNWEREFSIFAPHLNVVKYHGSQLERRDLRNELEMHLPERNVARLHHGLAPLDVILAPVTYFQKENSDDRNFLRKFKLDYLVVDEAHLLKNAKGMRYQKLDRFSTRHRLLLTGTPVQNSPKELMSLLCFLMPLFSRKSQGSYYDEDAKNGDGGERMLHHFVTLEGRKNGTSDEAAYRKLKQLFAPFVLRRKKVDVLSQIMPPKERKVEYVDLEPVAKSLYDSILSDHIKSKQSGDGYSREHLFTQLRKAAHHPLLIRARYKSPTEKEHLARKFHEYGAFRGEGCTRERVTEELDKYNDFEIHLTALELVGENPHRRADLERYILDEQDLFRSAKFVRLKKLLPELVNNGHRILIFSCWTSCLDLLSCLLEHLGLDSLRMEGSTPVSERQSLIDKFTRETSIPIFLLSTKACGLGINLTAADVCIMHDLDFNPFNDMQAEDRCHRIGQKKKVTVIKFVTQDTVDEDIYAMQERKARMESAIMESSKNGSSSKWDDANKEAKEAKDAFIKNAVDRYLRPPPATNTVAAAAGFGKENNDTIVLESDAV